MKQMKFRWPFKKLVLGITVALLSVLPAQCASQALPPQGLQQTRGGQPVMPVSTVALSGLRVAGNRLVNARGQTVILHGVNRSGAEYACIQGWGIFDGPADAESVQAIKSWHVNAVRVPLNEDCWLGINGVPPQFAGKNYQQAILRYVRLLNQYGMYVILDLHWAAPGKNPAINQQPMPDADHSLAFWKSVATTFKSNTTVLFDLFNEPYPDNNTADSKAAWRCWKNGGVCAGVPYIAAGFQQLVNVVRATGAKNVMLLGGIGYAGSLSEWLSYMPFDPLHNIAASWHVYNKAWCSTLACWNSQAVPVMKRVPVVVDEMGEMDCKDVFINPLMKWLDQHGTGYLAWAWNRASCALEPALITSYNGTPTPYGIGLRNHFLAISR